MMHGGDRKSLLQKQWEPNGVFSALDRVWDRRPSEGAEADTELLSDRTLRVLPAYL